MYVLNNCFSTFSSFLNTNPPTIILIIVNRYLYPHIRHAKKEVSIILRVVVTQVAQGKYLSGHTFFKNILSIYICILRFLSNHIYLSAERL